MGAAISKKKQASFHPLLILTGRGQWTISSNIEGRAESGLPGTAMSTHKTVVLCLLSYWQLFGFLVTNPAPLTSLCETVGVPVQPKGDVYVA